MSIIAAGNLIIARFVTDEPEVLEHDLKKDGTVNSMHYHDDWNVFMEAYAKIGKLLSLGDKDGIYSNIGFNITAHPGNQLKAWAAMKNFCEWYKETAENSKYNPNI